MDTSTPEGRKKRLYQLVDEYTQRHNIRGLVRLIGGSPRYDLGDYLDSDAGEEPKMREE